MAPPLREYIESNGLSQRAFARAAKVPHAIIGRICCGGDTSGRYWARIVAATGGLIRPEHHFPPPRAVRRAA